jgi:hypothetical protein
MLKPLTIDTGKLGVPHRIDYPPRRATTANRGPEALARTAKFVTEAGVDLKKSHHPPVAFPAAHRRVEPLGKIPSGRGVL